MRSKMRRLMAIFQLRTIDGSFFFKGHFSFHFCVPLIVGLFCRSSCMPTPRPPSCSTNNLPASLRADSKRTDAEQRPLSLQCLENPPDLDSTQTTIPDFTSFP